MYCDHNKKSGLFVNCSG
ncbi:Protein of unknown function [Streptococcus thermophilus]|nr:Protein of unknown function [Streptococcus thermophilus]